MGKHTLMMDIVLMEKTMTKYSIVLSHRKVRPDMAKYEITAEMNLKKIIAESREVAQALNEFADNLEQIEKKYAEPQESEDKE